MTERAQNADFRRKPQIFADSPLPLEIQASGGHRKPQILAENRRFSQKTAGNRRSGSVTLGVSSLALPYLSLSRKEILLAAWMLAAKLPTIDLTCCLNCWKNTHQSTGQMQNKQKQSKAFLSDASQKQKRPDVHKIVLSIKMRLPLPREEVSVLSLFYRFVQFFLIWALYVGGGETNFADKNLWTPRLF